MNSSIKKQKAHSALLFLISSFLFFIDPLQTHALPFSQGKIITYDEISVTLMYSNMRTESTYKCLFENFICEQISIREIPELKPKTETPVNVVPPSTPQPKRIGIFQTYSQTKKYRAGYTGINPIKKTRSFKFENTQTGEVFEFGKSTSKITWDILRDETRLFSFSPQDNFLIYLDNRSGFSSLNKIDLPISGSIKENRLITKSYTVADFIVWDDSTLFFTANKESPHTWNLYRLDIEKGSVEKIAKDISYGPKLIRVYDMLLFSQIHPTQTDPTLYNPKTKTLSRFSISDTSVQKLTQKEISIGKLSGVLMPSNTKKAHPLIIWLHGGPYRQTSLGYHSYASYNGYEYVLRQAQAQGASVLKLDYSGSFGYGRNFAERLYKTVGVQDVADVKQARDVMIKKENINSVYVVGNSYGGYLAVRSLVAHPKSFKGAVTIAGVSDWKELLTDLDISIFNAFFNGKPQQKNQALFKQASITDRIGRLTNQKILIIHGEDDTTIPLSQASLLYEKLTEKNKHVTLVTYPLEDHVFVQEKTILDICKNLLTFVELSTEHACK